MKTGWGKLIAVIVLTTMFYVGASMLAGSFDPKRWSEAVRGTTVGLWAVFSVFIFCIPKDIIEDFF